MNILKFIKDLIAPKKCYSCNKEWHFLCRECEGKIKKFDSHCYVCKNQSYNFEVDEGCKEDIFYDKIIIFTHYREKIIKKMIKNLKFYHKKDIAEDFWQYLWEYFFDYENIWDNNDYIIIPAPMYFLRKWRRWYNHSEILAKHISKITGIEYINGVKKIKNTSQQSKNSRTDRLKNLENTFTIHKKYLEKIDKKNIILVDDVYLHEPHWMKYQNFWKIMEL